MGEKNKERVEEESQKKKEEEKSKEKGVLKSLSYLSVPLRKDKEK